MKPSRRDVLLGSSAIVGASLFSSESNAWLHPGTSTVIPTGWHTLPVGAGGLVIGLDIAPDGTAVAWSDVGGSYYFSGKLPADFTNGSAVWQQVMNYNTLGSGYAAPGGATTWNGSLCMAIAPSQTSRIYSWMPNSGGGIWTWALYVSNDSCASWNKCTYGAGGLVNYTTDGGSNGTWRRTAQLVAVDPNNANVVYAGMLTNNVGGSGASAGCFVSIDGAAFNPVTSNGVTNLPAVTTVPGCHGIMFDKNSGTVVGIGGLTVTKRILIPIAGTDVYESLDGGVTFNTTGLATAAGRSDIAVLRGGMDFDGVYYCLVAYGGSSAAGNIWRYQSGVWSHLGNIPVSGAYPSGNSVAPATACCIVVDPRSGHQGFVSVYGPNGIGQGFTSTNANTATPASIAWSGSTGGQLTTTIGPTNDVPYLTTIRANGTGAFCDAPMCIIDGNGYQWWCGQQGVVWLFTQSDLTTPTIVSYNSGTVSYSVSCSRGAEATVSQCAARPPGGTYPIVAMQDVGVHQSGFVQYKYAADWFPSPSRSDATSLSWNSVNAAYMAVRCTAEGSVPSSCGKSGYSTNFGATGSWTLYPNQPDPFYQASFTASVSSNVMTVTAVANGLILPGSGVYLGSITGAQSGNVISQLTNTNPSGHPWQEGTYQTSGTPNTASQTIQSYNLSTGGQVVLIDPDHHLVVPFDSGVAGVYGGLAQQAVVYSTNVTSSCTWQPAYDLPAWSWLRRGYASGASAKAFAADHVNVGTVYGIQCYGDSGSSSNAFIDNGAGGGSYNGVSGTVMTVLAVTAGTSFVVGQTVYVGSVTGTVKGKIASLGTGTGGVGTYNLDTASATPAGTLIGATASIIWKSTSYGASGTWSQVSTLQVGTGGNYGSPLLFTVPGYAGHLFFTSQFTSGPGAGLWFSSDAGATWAKITTPASPYSLPSVFTLGIGTGGGYPTLYFVGWNGNATTVKIFYGNNFDPVAKTVTWNTMGPTGLTQDLPNSCQFGGFGTIEGDWNTYGLLFVPSGTLGFAYFKM